jgi:hypothetical protein
MRPCLVLAVLVLVAPGLPAQSTLLLPLPVEGPSSAQNFRSQGPTAGVLTGLELPSQGPLTAWAPVFSTLGADGRLSAGQTGTWFGKLPSRWVRLVKAGYVVAGFRVLVRTAPLPVQVRQLQVFWMPWTNGAPQGTVVESGVYGAKAGAQDTVRIIELRLPDGAVPTGLYGQVSGDAVLQASLIVRQGNGPAAAPVAPAGGPQGSHGPAGPASPSVSGPAVPLLN